AQTYNMSVIEYAQEFIRLSKYAQRIVPTEAARVQRFRQGLITPLYTALVATEFSTLSHLIDKARLCEIRFNKEKAEREQRRTETNKRQSSQNRSEGVSFNKRQVTQPNQVASQGQFRKGQGRGQFQNAPEFSQSSNKTEIPICATCGRRHTGE